MLVVTCFSCHVLYIPYTRGRCPKMLIAEIVRVVNEGDAATFFQSGTLNLEVRELCIFLMSKSNFSFSHYFLSVLLHNGFIAK